MSGTLQKPTQTALAERYEALLRVSQTLISIRSSKELFSILAHELRAVVNFYFLRVGIYDENAPELRLTLYGEPGVPPPGSTAPEGGDHYVVGIPASTALDHSFLRRGDSIPLPRFKVPMARFRLIKGKKHASSAGTACIRIWKGAYRTNPAVLEHLGRRVIRF
jgi:hypothetical protein